MLRKENRGAIGPGLRSKSEELLILPVQLQLRLRKLLVCHYMPRGCSVIISDVLVERNPGQEAQGLQYLECSAWDWIYLATWTNPLPPGGPPVLCLLSMRVQHWRAAARGMQEPASSSLESQGASL
jgi:hypothetical protein